MDSIWEFYYLPQSYIVQNNFYVTDLFYYLTYRSADARFFHSTFFSYSYSFISAVYTSQSSPGQLFWSVRNVLDEFMFVINGVKTESFHQWFQFQE